MIMGKRDPVTYKARRRRNSLIRNAYGIITLGDIYGQFTEHKTEKFIHL